MQSASGSVGSGSARGEAIHAYSASSRGSVKVDILYERGLSARLNDGAGQNARETGM